MRRLLLLFVAAAGLMSAAATTRVKVACVGNSVTYGAGLADREHEAYPAQLQRLLGDEYEVRNFGHNGATLLSRGHRPYVRLPEFRQALDYDADCVVIHLGLNDTDPRNWPDFRDDFVADYEALIDSFRMANPRCRIWICRLTPIFDRHPRFRSGTRDWHRKIQSAIEAVATGREVGLIDLNTPLHSRPDLFPDALHPNAEGAAILARTVYSALTGDYGGLRLSPVYADSMVLQRDRPLPLRGQADAGERVTVSIGGQRLRTTAGPDGRWSRIVYLPCTAEGGFKPDLPDERVDVVYLCSPNNPTGVALTRDELKRWVDYALANEVLLLFDAAYEAFVRHDDVPHSVYEIDGARDCAVEFRSFSKTAGFTGVRCGYTVVPRCLKVRGADGRYVALTPLWNRRQCTKFNGASYITQEHIDYYLANARLLREGAARAGLEAYGGEDSPYVWLRTPEGCGSWAFFDRLLADAGLVTTPGVGFGPCGEGYVRLTAFNTHEATAEAVERLATL